MPTVHDILAANSIRVTPDTTLEEAARAMAEADIGFLPVVDGTRGSPSTTALGVLTDHDLVVRGIARGLDPATTPVSHLYTRDSARSDDRSPALEIRRLSDGDSQAGAVSFMRITGLAGDSVFDDTADPWAAGGGRKVEVARL